MQEASNDIQLSEEKFERARELAEQYRESFSRLTSDSVVQASQLKQCESELASVTAERDMLQADVHQNRGPFYDEVHLLSLMLSNNGNSFLSTQIQRFVC